MSALPSRLRRAALVLAALTCLQTGAIAQERPARIIVAASAGSGTDGVMRAISPVLTRLSGQAVVIENVAGAGGVAGTAAVVRGAKDGTVFGAVSSNHAANSHLFASLPYDAEKDIVPVAIVGTVPLVLVANTSVPADNLKDLIAFLKAKPGAYNYGAGGIGGAVHLAGELFANEAKVQVRAIPYKTSASTTADLIGGEIQYTFMPMSAAVGLVQAGKVKALGLTTAQRSNVLPQVPTIAEAAIPGYSYDAWVALVAPAGVPKATIERWNGYVKTALKDKDVLASLAGQGVTALDVPADKLNAYFDAEFAKHAQLVKLAGVKPQ